MHSERPIDWRRRFGREAPIIVEIGFGNGAYLVRQAQEQPERDFVGIELEWPSVQRGLRRIAQAGVSNVRILQVDARVAFERLFTPRSVHHIYSLFPCPWRKEKHIKHRLFGHGFLKLLNSRLVDGGTIHVVTDYEPYVEWIVEQAQGTGFDLRVERIPPRYGTKYERKWLEQGQAHFFELWFAKETHVDIPLKEDIPLKTYRVARFDPKRFQPKETRGDITVVFKAFLYDPERQTGMVRVVAVEEGLTQDFWIEITPHKGQWAIRPAPGCGFVPTVAVQRALDLVYEAARGE
jgi:tRNA (guanine-N7-)-methyltransferase